MKYFHDGAHIVRSSKELDIDDKCYLINPNCELEFDSAYGVFDETKYTYIVDVWIEEEDLTKYIPIESTNDGAYAYATGKIRAGFEELEDYKTDYEREWSE